MSEAKMAPVADHPHALVDWQAVDDLDAFREFWS